MTPEMNILLVEDNDVDVEIFKRSLRKIGANGTLVRARDGQEALDVLCNGQSTPPIPHPFLVMLDVNMPRMNGHEFLAALRSAKDLAQIRVVVLTTSEDPRDINLAYQKNAAGYIVKPNTSAELTDALSTLQSFWENCRHPHISAECNCALASD